jgi:amidase
MSPTGEPELATIDAVGQAQLVARGDVQPIELVEAALDRLARVNPTLNAVIHERAEAARAECSPVQRGPFAGVPFVLKDMIAHSQGDPYHLGLDVLRRRGWVAASDTDLVRRFKGAGFILVGRTNTPELAGSFTTEPRSYGATHNPWRIGFSPGGSSGGSAAAVAAGIVPVGHGNDMGGSIRVPAAFTGTIGLKGTRGRTSLGPDHGELHGAHAHEGIITRSIRDTAAVLDVIGHPSPGDPYFAPPPQRPYAEVLGVAPDRLRVGLLDVDPRGEVTVDPAIRRAVLDAGAALEELGHCVTDAYPSALSERESSRLGWPIMGVAFARHLRLWSGVLGSPIGPNDVEPMTWELAEAGRTVTAEQYVEALEDLYAWARRISSWWGDDGYDLLLTPTTPLPAPRLGYLAPDVESTVLRERLLAYGLFTAPFNTTGQPAISLPIGRDQNGIPFGVQLVARYGRDDALLQVSAQLEEAFQWSGSRPAVHA